MEARAHLARAVGTENESVRRLDSMLAFEFGGKSYRFNRQLMLRAIEDPNRSINKQALKLLRVKARQHDGVDYLNPGDTERIPGAKSVRVFVLGPPRDADLLQDEDPQGEEGFPREADSHGLTFSAAARAQANSDAISSPFREHFRVSTETAATHPFFSEYYGFGETGQAEIDAGEVHSAAPWRRIDSEWLFSAEELALKLNTGINNTSLVLAFELPKSKKVLLFVGDAQRGNWVSWDKCTDGDTTVTAKDLLSRAVLYKVGHHGSHNATLAGKAGDTYPNLSWMAKGKAAGEFTAMITAVNKWAMKQDPPWVHPLPAIEAALKIKTQGRLFRTDVDTPPKPDDVSKADWEDFQARASFEKLYFDYLVYDR